MVITSDYYQLYYHYKELSEQYSYLTTQHHAYGHIADCLANYLQETPQEQRNYVGILIRELETSNPVVLSINRIWVEEIKTLKTFLNKTGEYSE